MVMLSAFAYPIRTLRTIILVLLAADFFAAASLQLPGVQEKSNREYVVAYVGDVVFAVKWRTMKLHFATAEATHAPIVQQYTFPQVFDIKEDVKESHELWGNGGYAHAWVMAPVTKILGNLAKSMKTYRNIRPGEDFKGY